MDRREERRAATVLLAVALAGVVVRLVGAAGTGPAGSVAYVAADSGSRPGQEDVARRAEALARPLRRGERIDVDTAGIEQLVRLPRIGPGLAARIVENRETVGAFGALDALGRVPGIGPRTLEELEPYVAFSGHRVAPRAAPAARRLAVNRASAEELAALPGIGPIRAEAIVDDRARNGPFRSPDDLTRVKGIGPATVERIRPLVAIP